MIVLSIAKLKMFSPNKAKKEKKTFLWKVWINLEVRKKATNDSCDEPTSV